MFISMLRDKSFVSTLYLFLYKINGEEKIGANLQRIVELSTRNVLKLPKILVWDQEKLFRII